MPSRVSFLRQDGYVIQIRFSPSLKICLICESYSKPDYATMKFLFPFLPLLIAVSAVAQTPTPTTNFYNKVWHYSLSGYEVDISFSSDTTIHWQDKTRGETDKSKTIWINDHTLLVGWHEFDKTIVSLYSDLTSGEAYCQVFKPGGAIQPVRGRFVLKK